jgi:hypothetical protein
MNADRVNRRLIKKRGGNSFKPALAKVNPMPHMTGTDNANPKSLTVRRNMQIFLSYSRFEVVLQFSIEQKSHLSVAKSTKY